MNSADHLTAGMVADYQARRLRPAQIRELLDHADRCHPCSTMLAGALEFDGEEHLGKQEAVDYVALDGPRRGIEAHLTQCEACRRVVEELRLSRDETDKAGRQERKPRQVMQLTATAAALVAATAVWWAAASHRPHAEPSAPVLVSSLRDGPALIGVTASGEVSGLPGLTVTTREFLHAALTSGRLPGTSMETQPDAGSRGALRGAEGSRSSFRILAPEGGSGGSAEYSDRPVFRWSPLAGAESYEVAVFDLDHEVARSGKLTATVWQPTRPLPRRALTWQVAATRQGNRMTAPRPPEPAAVFQILSEEAFQSIEAQRAGAHPSHLLLAVLYSKAGLREEAAEQVRLLAEQNPDSSLVESLERSVAPAR